MGPRQSYEWHWSIIGAMITLRQANDQEDNNYDKPLEEIRGFTDSTSWLYGFMKRKNLSS